MGCKFIYSSCNIYMNDMTLIIPWLKEINGKRWFVQGRDNL